MKIDTMAAPIGGTITSAVAVLHEFGTTPAALLLAVVGAFLALIELEERTRGKAVVLITFNVMVGLMAAPLIVEALATPHPFALGLFSFLGGYFSHDMIGRVIEATIKKRLGGK